jgi:hypothetical protein
LGFTKMMADRGSAVKLTGFPAVPNWASNLTLASHDEPLGFPAPPCEAAIPLAIAKADNREKMFAARRAPEAAGVLPDELKLALPGFSGVPRRPHSVGTRKVEAWLDRAVDDRPWAGSISPGEHPLNATFQNPSALHLLPDAQSAGFTSGLDRLPKGQGFGRLDSHRRV